MKTVTRAMALGTPDAETRCVPVTLSTEAPVDRGDYIEILDHRQGSVDLSRAPLPLIESHDQYSLNIGVVEDLKLVGRTLKGTARFGNSTRGQEVFQDVLDGIVRSVSIGYEYTSPGVPEGKDGDTLRFKFMPLEASAVAIPADINAGFFRNYQENTMNDTNMTNESNNTLHLSRSQRRNEISSQEAERARCAEITAMCTAHDIESDTALRFVREGSTVEQAREYILNRQLAKGASTRPTTMDYRNADDYIDMGREAQDFSISRAINAIISNDWRHAGLERAASETIAKRIGRASQGGFFVPLDTRMTRASYAAGALGTGGAIVATNLLADAFVDILRNKCRVMELGATVLSGLVGNIDVPRRATATPAFWVAEGGAVTEGEGTFDKLSLSPKTIGTLSKYSRNMLMQATPDIEMLIRSDMAAQLALGIDLAALAGTGTGNQPTGILNTAGIGSVVGGTNGAQLTIDHLISLAKSVEQANADGSNMAFMLNASSVGWLSQIKSTTGEYLWSRDEGSFNRAPLGGAGDNLTILGKRLAISNQLPSNLSKGTSSGICSALVYGNWSDVIIGEWGVLEILPNPYDSTAYTQGAVLIRAMQSVDIGVRHAASFSAMADALTA